MWQVCDLAWPAKPEIDEDADLEVLRVGRELDVGRRSRRDGLVGRHVLARPAPRVRPRFLARATMHGDAVEP